MNKYLKLTIYAVISILSFFAFSWFKTVNAATISTNSGTLYEGAWKGNSRDQNAYRLLYDGISGQTSNFAYGNAPFLYVNDIFMSVLNANANESVSYIAEISVCQTNTDYNLNYDSGSVHSQITNIERLRAVKAGGCYVNVYNGNLVNYYFKVTGNVIKYSNPESDYGFDGQEYVLRWTNGTYNEFSVKNVTFTEYTTELYNSIIQANSLDDIKSAIEKQKEDTNNKLDQQINQNQTIIDQNNQTNSKLDEAETTRKGILGTIKEVLSYVNPFSENFFAYKLVELLINALKSLFIPEDMSFVTDFVEALESKLGFIAEIPVKIIEFTLSLATATWSEFKSISFPTISIFGYNFWNAQEIDLTEAINIFKPFKYVTDVICVVICAQTLNKWRERFTGGSK